MLYRWLDRVLGLIAVSRWQSQASLSISIRSWNTEHMAFYKMSPTPPLATHSLPTILPTPSHLATESVCNTSSGRATVEASVPMDVFQSCLLLYEAVFTVTPVRYAITEELENIINLCAHNDHTILTIAPLYRLNKTSTP